MHVSSEKFSQSDLKICAPFFWVSCLHALFLIRRQSVFQQNPARVLLEPGIYEVHMLGDQVESGTAKRKRVLTDSGTPIGLDRVYNQKNVLLIKQTLCTTLTKPY